MPHSEFPSIFDNEDLNGPCPNLTGQLLAYRPPRSAGVIEVIRSKTRQMTTVKLVTECRTWCEEEIFPRPSSEFLSTRKKIELDSGSFFDHSTW